MKAILLPILFVFCVNTIKGQIIADHNAVDDFDNIPDEYLEKVKRMVVEMAGESHASGFNYGQELLAILYPICLTDFWDGTPPVNSNGHLRLGSTATTSDGDYFTNTAAIESYKQRIANQNNSGVEFDVMGFVWCWDMYYTQPNSWNTQRDPVYNVRWGGSVEQAPQNIPIIGLDDGDQNLTENSVSVQSYLDAVVNYQEYCVENGWKTKIIFTTGPVDDTYPVSAGTEDGVQREIKHDFIREFVKENSERILFDYADILCWNNNGEKHTETWDDNGNHRIHAHLHPDNTFDYDDNLNVIPGEEDGDHIGEIGSVRISKALWWMLARIAGWEGVATTIANTTKNNCSKLFTSSNQIRIEICDEVERYDTVCFYDIKGSKVSERIILKDSIDLSTVGWRSGVYLVVLSGSTHTETFKVFIN